MSISTLESRQSRNELDAMWRESDAKQAADDRRQDLMNKVCATIREFDGIDCDEVAQILCTLNVQMIKAGFPQCDVENMQDLINTIS